MYNKIINNFLNSVPKKDKKGSTKMSEVISLINEREVSANQPPPLQLRRFFQFQDITFC